MRECLCGLTKSSQIRFQPTNSRGRNWDRKWINATNGSENGQRASKRTFKASTSNGRHKSEVNHSSPYSSQRTGLIRMPSSTPSVHINVTKQQTGGWVRSREKPLYESQEGKQKALPVSTEVCGGGRELEVAENGQTQNPVVTYCVALISSVCQHFLLLDS